MFVIESFSNVHCEPPRYSIISRRILFDECIHKIFTTRMRRKWSLSG